MKSTIRFAPTAPTVPFVRLTPFAPSHTARGLLLAAVLAALALPGSVRAAPGFAPSGAFVQGGAGDSANAVVVGATWDWQWQRNTGWGDLSGYWEISFGRWNTERTDGSTAHDWVGQVGITPVLRLTPQAWGRRWFVEGGIGANVLLPIFRAEDKRFSTAFNFGDHIAVGRRFGDSAEHELALRIQHFSNGGIKRPNPGENFVQLRYTRHF